MANHASKKLDGVDGVAFSDSTESAAPILQHMNPSDVWGIGSRTTKIFVHYFDLEAQSGALLLGGLCRD